jgi:hypothetical protein
MQDRFVGDLIDFAKFGLLHRLAGSGKDRAFRLGVVWYLTPDRGRPAARQTRYLAGAPPNPYAEADPRLFARLRQLLAGRRRRVRHLMPAGLLPAGTAFYDAPLSYQGIPPQRAGDRLGHRVAWLEGALRATARCGLVFLDPDTGLAPPGVLRHERAGLRYAYPDEVRPFLERGQAVVLLQFLTRDGLHAVQVRDYLRKAAEAQPTGAPAPFALWWRRGASVAFLVLPASRVQAALLQRRVRILLATPWGRLLSPSPELCTLPGAGEG